MTFIGLEQGQNTLKSNEDVIFQLYMWTNTFSLWKERNRKKIERKL